MKKVKRDLFSELMSGVNEMSKHREGKITLKTYKQEAKSLPRLTSKKIKAIREKLNLSQGVFAQLIGTSPSTLANWEQGRTQPNDQAVALMLLVDQYPDTLERLREIAA